MKRFLTVLFVLILACSFALVTSAEEATQDTGEEIRTYVEEKIVPILMGVATSIIALLGTLKGVFNALKGLKESKATFDKEQAKIKENSKRELEEIKKKYEEIKASIEDVPELLSKINIQNETIERLESIVYTSAEILSLAYSANSELVRTGKAKQMTQLLEQIRGQEKETASETI